MNKILLIILALMVIAGLYLLFRPDTPAQYTGDTQQEENGQDVVNEFITYSNPRLGFSILRPAASQVTEEGGGVKIMHLGPEALPNTEITDGFTVTIIPRSTSTSPLVTAAGQARESAVSGGAESPTALEEISISGMAAYRYSYTTVLGNRSTDVILKPDERVYVITYSIYDPADRGYEASILRMLESLSFQL